MINFTPFTVNVGGQILEFENYPNVQRFLNASIATWAEQMKPEYQKILEGPSLTATIPQGIILALRPFALVKDAQILEAQSGSLTTGPAFELVTDTYRVVSDFASVHPDVMFRTKNKRALTSLSQTLQDSDFQEAYDKYATPSMRRRAVAALYEQLNPVNALQDISDRHEESKEAAIEHMVDNTRRIHNLEEAVGGLHEIRTILETFKEASKAWPKTRTINTGIMIFTYLIAGAIGMLVLSEANDLVHDVSLSLGTGWIGFRNMLLSAAPIGLGITAISVALRFAHTSRMAALDAEQRNAMFLTYVALVKQNGFKIDDKNIHYVLDALFRRADLSGSNKDDQSGQIAVDALTKLVNKE